MGKKNSMHLGFLVKVMILLLPVSLENILPMSIGEDFAFAL